MHYIAHLAVRGFYCRALGGDSPESPPLIVHRDRAVLDANDAARRMGARIGMGVQEARALLRGEGSLVAWEEEPYRLAQAAWLDVCAVYADVIEPEGQHAAYVDLSGHAQPHAVLEQIRSDLRAQPGHETSAGLAGAKWVARLAGTVGDPSGEALRTPRRFVARHPTTHLAPVREDHRRQLVFLGYRRIGEVSELGLETLRRQFGDEALTIAIAAQGGGDCVVRAVYPPDSVSGRFTYEGPPETWECFDRGLLAIAREVGDELRERDLAGKELCLFLEHEDTSVTRVARCFTKPMDSVYSVLIGLRLLASTLEPAPVVGVRVRMPGLQASASAQASLEIGGTSATERGRAESAIARLRAAFGDHCVRTAAELSVPRRTLVMRAFRAANGWH